MLKNISDNELLSSDLVITHALPGVESALWADAKAAEFPDKVVSLGKTEIRRELFGDEYVYRKHSPGKEVEVEKEFHKLVGIHLDAGETVICSEPSVRPSFMSKLANVAVNRGKTFSQKYFEISADDAKRQNAVLKAENKVYSPDYQIDRLVKEGYGSDGRIKEFRIGAKATFGRDRAESASEKFVKDFNKKLSDARLDMPKQAVLFDCDGALFDVREIRDHAFGRPGEKRDFDYFHKAGKYAPVNPDVVKIAHEAHQNDFAVIVTTARTNNYAAETIYALESNGIPVDRLHMRLEGDERSDREVKRDIYVDIVEAGFNPIAAVDDNPLAIAGWEDSGMKNITKIEFFEPRDPATNPDVSSHIEVKSPFVSGVCLRCGRPLKGGQGYLGPKCKTK
jgi:hypothetical protein